MLVGKTGIPVLSALTSSDIASFQSFDSVSGVLEKKKDEILNGAKKKIKVHT
jgi:hypothetical protein